MKKMPTVGPNALMKAALHLSLFVSNHAEENEIPEWNGWTWFYFDAAGRHGLVGYEQRAGLKTREGAMARQKRETIQYLKDLRTQIDDVLTALETVDMTTDDPVRVYSSAYTPPAPQAKGMSDR